MHTNSSQERAGKSHYILGELMSNARAPPPYQFKAHIL